MVQKAEELCESGTAPYFDASCAVVSLVTTSLTWSDRTVIAPRLYPLQLLVHTYVYTTDFITMHAAILFWFVGWAYFRVINDPLQITFSGNGGWTYFWGWAYFREAMVFMQISTNVSLTMAVGVGARVVVVGPLSSKSDLCEHFQEFFFSACAQQDLF